MLGKGHYARMATLRDIYINMYLQCAFALRSGVSVHRSERAEASHQVNKVGGNSCEQNLLTPSPTNATRSARVARLGLPAGMVPGVSFRSGVVGLFLVLHTSPLARLG